MISIPDIVTLKVSIDSFSGLALAEKYPNGSIIILERNYGNVSDIVIEVNLNREKIVDVIFDWGELYEKHKPNLE